MSTNPATAEKSTPLTFFVAPDGNDAWSGTVARANAKRTDGPFATITRARDAVRELKQREGGLKRPVRVYLRGGTYYLTAPLVLTPQDSGTKECPITYAAYRNEQPVLSGGVRITGWQPGEVNGKACWTAHLPAVARGEWYFRELFVNGERRPRPRLPKDGFYRFEGSPGVTKDTPWNEGQKQAIYADGDLKAWHNLSDVEIVAFHLWVDSHLPIAGLDEHNRIATFTGPSIFRLTEDFASGGARYWVENVFEALDTPGQWYLDRPTGTLYYLPKPGEDPGQVEVIAPRIAQAVRLEGDPEKQQWVEHIRLQGLAFMHTEWNLPPESAGASQASHNVPGAIRWQGARSCALRGCTMAHIGSYAVELVAGCYSNTIKGNAMFDLAAGGVKVGPGAGRTTIADNEIGDGGHVFHSAVGVWIGNSGRNQVIHNHIHDFDYTGVSVGWTWGYGPSDAVGNRIEFNHIHHVGRGMLSDLGGIYTLGVSPGTILRNNLIHDSWSATYGGWGIYLDEGSSGILVEDNVVYRTKTGGFHQHYGRENLIRNNIFAFGKEMQITRSREEEHRSFSFERNIVYWTEGALLSGTWKNGNFFFDRNVYWQAVGEPFAFGPYSVEEWRRLGMDVHSVIADPKFVDPAHDDFALAPDSPAFALGFQAIDISQVGPRTSRQGGVKR